LYDNSHIDKIKDVTNIVKFHRQKGQGTSYFTPYALKQLKIAGFHLRRCYGLWAVFFLKGQSWKTNWSGGLVLCMKKIIYH